MFIEQLDTALHKVYPGKKPTNKKNTKYKEYYMDPLESKNKWKEWESKFIHYMSVLILVNIFTLSYAMR